MLNISNESIDEKIEKDSFKSFQLLKVKGYRGVSMAKIFMLMFLFFLVLFLPWTQNIRAKGQVTVLRPEQSPNSIQAVISGRIEKWYVQEGQFVSAGDTIIHLSEINTTYFDPEIIQRTEEQLDAKNQSIVTYQNKVRAIGNQNAAMVSELELKLKQTKNKIDQEKNYIQMDSMDLIALRNNLAIAENQLTRFTTMYEKGLQSLNSLQEKELKVQELLAKNVAQKNKLQNRRQSLNNAQIELLRLNQEYRDKISKAQSDKQSAISNKLESIVETSKLRNTLANYTRRQSFYFITAPQEGYITRSIKKGIGEIVSAGEDIVTIMPANYDLAVEIHIRPQDLPLIQEGTKVQIRFDGWPAVVISGWPESSTGVFAGQIFAVDQFIGKEGYYRTLIKPSNADKPWPDLLRVGAGVETYILLNNVPIWYEVWRQLNGFPPDFYQKKKQTDEDVKLKAPIKSIK